MAIDARSTPRLSGEGSCRLCRGYCDWVVEPAGCVDQGCTNLYAYDDASGRRIVGCLAGVLPAELDLETFERVRAEAGGRLGGLRAARRPLPICHAYVQTTYPARLGPAGCLNPEFAEAHVGDPFRVTRRRRGV